MKKQNIICMLLCFWALFSLPAEARIFDRVEQKHTVLKNEYIKTADGITLRINHLQRHKRIDGKPGRPPFFLLVPGFGAQGMSLALLAEEAYLGGFDVGILNWRGSVLVPHQKTLATDNSFETLVNNEIPAALDYLEKNYLTVEQKEAGITIMGHSMGGMLIMGMLSNPTLSARYMKRLSSVVLLQSPHHLKYLPFYWRPIAVTGTSLLSGLSALGVNTVDLQGRSLQTREAVLSTANNMVSRTLINASEITAQNVFKLIFDPKFTNRETTETFIYEMAAYGIPNDLAQSFARAIAKDEGEFLSKAGAKLLRPEQVSSQLPVLLIRSLKDSLANRREQKEYFAELGSHFKQLLTIHDWNHVHTLISDKPGSDFMHYVLAFASNPKAAALRQPKIEFHPYCESWLSQRVGRFLSK